MIVYLPFSSSFWSLHTAVQHAVVAQEELSYSDARQSVKTIVYTVIVPACCSPCTWVRADCPSLGITGWLLEWSGCDQRDCETVCSNSGLAESGIKCLTTHPGGGDAQNRPLSTDWYEWLCHLDFF